MILDINKITDDDILKYIDNIKSYDDDIIEANIDTIFRYYLKKTKCNLGYRLRDISIYSIRDLKTRYKLIKKYCCFDSDVPALYLWNSLIFILENSNKYERNILIGELFKNVKFSEIKSILDMPSNLKFGVELEYYGVLLDDIKRLHNNNLISEILSSISCPNKIVKEVSNNICFEKYCAYDKWNFSKEGEESSPEVSSPIMKNTLDDLNQLKAMVVLFNALGAEINDGTALHINIGADYFKDNINALKYLLIIWSECEELFFKIANEEGEQIRIIASCMARPIKENIQKTFIENSNFIYDILYDFDKFIYNIQVREKLDVVIGFEDSSFEDELSNLTTDKEKYILFKKYLEKKSNSDTCVRYTSINFNHMSLNDNDKGRIEFRMFNNSLSYKTITQDILLIGKLCDTSLKLAKHDEEKYNQFKKLICHDITEEQKLDLLLDLLFEKEIEKKIFKQRWISIKNIPRYNQFNVGAETYIRNEKVLSKRIS